MSSALLVPFFEIFISNERDDDTVKQPCSFALVTYCGRQLIAASDDDG
jgi:hypothetical protein